MLRAKLMPHLQTFARLHVAERGDASALGALEASLHDEAGAADRDWRAELNSREAQIVLALECQAPVGAVEIRHTPDAAIASLIWLGVAHSARGRGVGRLLLEAAIDHARGEGAAVLRLGPMALSGKALNLLGSSGFVERGYGAAQVVFEKSLLDGHSAAHGRAFEPHYYGALNPKGTAAAALMVAMSSLDTRFMTTPQVERVVAAEIERAKAEGGTAAQAIGLAAVHRAFNACVRGQAAPGEWKRLVGDGALTVRPDAPSPEQLVGLLSLRQIPLLHTPIGRLDAGGSPSDWRVVLGFDGLLFQIFDPRRPDQRDQALTMAEMRAALAADEAQCVIVSRV